MYVNICVLVLAVIAIVLAAQGCKRGGVKEVISLISLFIAGIIIVLVTYGIRNYVYHNWIGVVLAVILLVAVGFIHKLLNIMFFSLKVISSLPVVGLLNTLLGIIIGLVEALIFYWVLCVCLVYLQMGSVSDFILQQISESTALTSLYNINPLFYALELVGAKIDEYSSVVKPVFDFIEQIY